MLKKIIGRQTGLAVGARREVGGMVRELGGKQGMGHLSLGGPFLAPQTRCPCDTWTFHHSDGACNDVNVCPLVLSLSWLWWQEPGQSVLLTSCPED